jgi:hypothetical protein
MLVPAIGAFDLHLRENGFLRKEVILGSLVQNHGMGELEFAVAARQNPPRHTIKLFAA